MEPTLGQIATFTEAKCHCCGANPPPPLVAFTVEKIWDGRRWVVLESYEGGWQAAELAARATAEPQ